MAVYRVARSIGAVLAISTLLALFMLDFWLVEHTLNQWVIYVLLGLIASLLGLNRILDQLPDTIEISFNGDARREHDDETKGND